ncbi:uncharacterized protein EAE97_008755 [Botrytis byssoidea]|uniref:NAD(P)-binding protein n=1 Tax=Botrytis byssoidea TaxID=139641 RepID=A0A9P5LXP2_9HELO|nr:uncharacterized protein EAE97_008755 [Botrytis byssoidea]KAF7932988.1 hypothetical protein EAE97_008755 [Botrytis byssoidea]
MSFTSMLTQYPPPPPPAPLFTGKDIPSQKGKVFIVTGGNQGVGFELIKMLYPTDATIYMASRSSTHALSAISEITASDPSRAGNLKFLHLDPMDLHSVRAAAEEFIAREENLDILWNNAGIGRLPPGTKTQQGIEGHMGVNVVGTFYFTRLLVGCLKNAVSRSEENSVRIVWRTSWMGEGRSPEGGFRMRDLENGGCGNEYVDYAASRAAGAYIIPWERIQTRNPRADIYAALDAGKGAELWEWCEEVIAAEMDG